MPRPDTTTPVREASLATQIHDTLTEMLLSGKLRPDDRLSMRDLAEQLGVSVMPVRDAVARLVAQQALIVLPNRAVTVPLLTRAEFRDLTEVRIHNETHAAAMAAARRRTAARRRGSPFGVSVAVLPPGRLPVDARLEHLGRPEGQDAPRQDRHLDPGLRVAADALALLPHEEGAEGRDLHRLAGGERPGETTWMRDLSAGASKA